MPNDNDGSQQDEQTPAERYQALRASRTDEENAAYDGWIAGQQL